MDYTKNYHLPQWVDEDRIMRQDFNSAMANIENGLSANRAEHAATAPRLLRLAYNNWQQLSALPEIPHQDGAFRQGFARGENPYDPYVPNSPETLSAVNGMAQLPDRLWTANWAQPLHINNFRSTFRVLSSISSENDTDTCSFTFTPPASGYLYNVVLNGTFSGNQKDAWDRWTNDGSCTVRIYDDISNELLQQSPSTLNLNGVSGWGFIRVPFAFFLIGKTRYRIEVQMKKLEINLDYTLDTSADALVQALELYGRKQETVSFSRQILAGDASQDGLVLVRYLTRGPASSITIDWLGKTLSPHTVRTVNFRGLEVKEAEFRPGTAVPADSTVTLNIQCGVEGEFSLFDWGAVLV